MLLIRLKLLSGILLGVLLGLTSQVLYAKDVWRFDIMPVRDIRPGMEGTGKTVFYGENVETFGFQVVEVVNNFYPQQDIIIVRLTGAKAEHAGVVQGMSGSPLYISGKLIGALALRLGDFQKDPIAGVMPIESMMQTRSFESQRAGGVPCAPQFGSHYLRASLMGTDPDFWHQVLSPLMPLEPAKLTARRIETPLVFSGFSEQGLNASASTWSALGFQPMIGGTVPKDLAAPSSQALEPGAALSQVFISGDFSVDMTGTVTAVDGDRVLAFGHHIFNLGPVQMPMARSRVLVTLASLMGSNKLAKSVEIIGSIRQDRLSGVYGEIGNQPSWTPIKLFLETGDVTQQFQFQMAADPALRNLMPFFLRSVLFQALVSGRLGADPSTVRLQCDIELADGHKVRLQDFFSYQERLGFLGAGSEVAEAADLIAASVGALTVNDLAAPPVTAITVTARIEPGERVAAIQAIRQDRMQLSPGDSLKLTMTLRKSDGQEAKYTQCVYLPQYLQARSLVVVAGGAAGLTLTELRSNPDKYRPRSFEKLLDILNQRRVSNNLYVQIRETAAGVAVNGQELTALPPSIMGTMSGRGNERYLRDRVLAEWVIPTDCEITGLERILVRVAQPKKKQTQMDNGFSIMPFME